jgi:hypothetical protein
VSDTCECPNVSITTRGLTAFATPTFGKESRRRGNSCMPRDPRAWVSDVLVACDLWRTSPEARASKTTPPPMRSIVRRVQGS